MSQYDAIGTQYDFIKTTAFNRLEASTFQTAVNPFLALPASIAPNNAPSSSGDANVLDLACGTGHYSQKLLSWGAANLTGVDLSPAMVKGAQARLAQEIIAGKARFVAGDGQNPTGYGPEGQTGSFDVATGVWFLNYAADVDQLTLMLKTIALNLKDTGVFVGITHPPTDDIATLAAGYDTPEMWKTGVGVKYVEELENKQGWRVRVCAFGEGGPEDEKISFHTIHLKQSVYDEAIRRAGFSGKVEWRDETRPESEEDLKWWEERGVGRDVWPTEKRVSFLNGLVIHKS